MEIDKSELDNRMFEGFAMGSKDRYVYVYNVETRVARWSANAVEYFELPGEYVNDAGYDWAKKIHYEDREGFILDLEKVHTGKSDKHELEYRVLNKEGDYDVCTSRGQIIRGEKGTANLLVGTIERHGVMDNVDATTNLYNIYEFWRDMQRHREDEREMTVLMVSINGFTGINDTYGYTFGNKLLKSVGVMLRSIINPMGTVYRMDGVRFACTLFGCDRDTICELYNKIQYAARYNLYISGMRLSVSMSAGAVIYNQNYDEHSILTSARYALAESKHKNHGELVFFDESLLEDNKKNLEIMNTIRECILNGCEGFYLCYQPIMDAKNEELIGAEALLRWNKEPFGEVPPGVFIPWLENDPSFYELGNWILKKALRESKAMVEKYPYFVVNVNVAYPQIERMSFVDTVKEILEETGYPATNLCLELTERCKQLDKKYLQQIVQSLKDLGIKIAIDDFGTGFSSLELLSELNVDTLKIDRAFMMDIPTNISNQAIVKAVTSCAKDLDINVCLEGVEAREIIDFVKKYFVYSYQGYYFSRPIPINLFKEKYCC